MPNKLGRDRWDFVFGDYDNTRAHIGTPSKVLPYWNDFSVSDRWCQLGNCKYSTWLFGINGAVKN